jgi:hypothetical protein
MSKPCPSLLQQRAREGFDKLSPNGLRQFQAEKRSRSASIASAALAASPP